MSDDFQRPVPLLSPSFRVSDIPFEAGCLSLLLHIERGGLVETFGNAPAALTGAKWADVRSWFVIQWACGIAWACRLTLKTEQAQPWTLQQLQLHHARHPQAWLEVGRNTPAKI